MDNGIATTDLSNDISVIGLLSGMLSAKLKTNRSQLDALEEQLKQLMPAKSEEYTNGTSDSANGPGIESPAAGIAELPEENSQDGFGTSSGFPFAANSEMTYGEFITHLETVNLEYTTYQQRLEFQNSKTSEILSRYQSTMSTLVTSLRAGLVGDTVGMEKGEINDELLESQLRELENHIVEAEDRLAYDENENASSSDFEKQELIRDVQWVLTELHEKCSLQPNLYDRKSQMLLGEIEQLLSVIDIMAKYLGKAGCLEGKSYTAEMSALQKIQQRRSEVLEAFQQDVPSESESESESEYEYNEGDSRSGGSYEPRYEPKALTAMQTLGTLQQITRMTDRLLELQLT